MPKHIIEINGVKMEVDTRKAKRVDTYAVGDRVKVLVKEYSSTEVYHGMIVGFENFETLPTIIVAYLTNGYSPEVRIAYLNTKTMTGEDRKFDIVPDYDEVLPVNKQDVLHGFNRQIDKCLNEIQDILMKKTYFITRFGRLFGEEAEETRKNELAALQERVDIADRVADMINTAGK